MDPWVILPMERERHSQQFLSCGPTDGFITGTQVEYCSQLAIKEEKDCTEMLISGERVLHAGRLTSHGVGPGAK